ALAISPRAKQTKLKHIQLVPIDSEQVLMVLVSNSGVVRNSILRIGKEMSESELIIISNFLNDKLKGLTIDEISEEISAGSFNEMYKFKTILSNVLPIINRSLGDIDSIELYL